MYKDDQDNKDGTVPEIQGHLKLMVLIFKLPTITNNHALDHLILCAYIIHHHMASLLTACCHAQCFPFLLYILLKFN